MTWEEMNYLHPITAVCTWGSDRKRLLIVEEEAQAGVVTVFRAYGKPL